MRIVFIFFFVVTALSLYSCSEKANEKIQPPQENSNSFFFVGLINNKSGLYKYDFVTKKVNEFWYSKNEEILELFLNDNNNKAFFVTAKKHGKKGAFPFVNAAKLYSIDKDSTVSLIKEIGNGLQVFGKWDDKNIFRILFNSIDSTVSNYINQQIFIYNSDGVLFSEETRVYNLLLDGYPLMPKNVNLTSPENNYAVDTSSNFSIRILLKNLDNNSHDLIKISDQKLKEVKWNLNDSLVILSTTYLNPRNKTIFSNDPQTSSLIIYSINKKGIENEWRGGGVKSFYLLNNMLIFDDGFSENSSINIYDFQKKRVVKTIRIDGGCGLKSIPLIPDFSV